MTKLVGLEQLNEAAHQLKSIHFNSDGELITPKFINFELITPKQAKKRNINSNKILVKSTEKYGNTLYTITYFIVIDENEQNVQIPKDGSEA